VVDRQDGHAVGGEDRQARGEGRPGAGVGPEAARQDAGLDRGTRPQPQGVDVDVPRRPDMAADAGGREERLRRRGGGVWLALPPQVGPGRGHRGHEREEREKDCGEGRDGGTSLPGWHSGHPYRADFASTFTVSQQTTALPSTEADRQTGTAPESRPMTARMSW